MRWLYGKEGGRSVRSSVTQSCQALKSTAQLLRRRYTWMKEIKSEIFLRFTSRWPFQWIGVQLGFLRFPGFLFPPKKWQGQRQISPNKVSEIHLTGRSNWPGEEFQKQPKHGRELICQNWFYWGSLPFPSHSAQWTHVRLSFNRRIRGYLYFTHMAIFNRVSKITKKVSK